MNRLLLVAVFALFSGSPSSLHGQPSAREPYLQLPDPQAPTGTAGLAKVSTVTLLPQAQESPSLAGKLDAALLDAWIAARTGDSAAAIKRLVDRRTTLAENGRDVVAIVTLTAPASTQDTATRITACGATIVRSGLDTIKIAVPIESLGAVASLPDVVHIRTIRPPQLYNTTKTEGLVVTLANAWHTAGFLGQGSKVAIVDPEFANLATLKAQDEIPASAIEVNYTASAMTAGTGSHGSGCAEIVYDMAPSAQLYLIKIDDATDFVAVKDYCVAQGIHIASASLGWQALNFHDGIAYANDSTTVASHPVTAVDAATASGILWAMAAGNNQYEHTLVDWRNGGVTPDNALDWNSSQVFLNLLLTPGGGSTTIPSSSLLSINMTWNQWPISNQDFDLELYRNTGSGWARVDSGFYNSGNKTQNGSSTSYPTEWILYQTTVSAQYAVAIKGYGTTTAPTFILRFSGVEPNYFGYGSVTPAPGSVAIPGDAATAFTVGALNCSSYTTGPIEYFSSLGPNNRAYTGGSAVTKPDICGPDQTASVTYGGPFGGTSAATPHIAGLAALVKSAYPAYTLAQVRSYIEANGLDLGLAGKDNTYGAGAARLPSPPVSNHAPVDIGLSNATIPENQPTTTTIGTLSTSDPDAGNSFTYALVAGTGSTDNGLFTISGASLRSAISFDYETRTSCSIRVRSTDQGALSTEKAFTIAITAAPLDVVHVDRANQAANPNGSVWAPFPTVTQGYNAVQPGKTIRIHAGNYPEAIANMNKQARLEATNGVVNIGIP